jgi:hypothetical protein
MPEPRRLPSKCRVLIRHHSMLWHGRANFLRCRCITADVNETSIMPTALSDSTSCRVCSNRLERALVPSFRVENSRGVSGKLEDVSEPNFGDQDKEMASSRLQTQQIQA